MVPIVIASAFGLRRSQLLGLRWKDLELELLTLSVVQVLQRINIQTVIHEPKTAKGRRLIALTPSSAQALRDHLQDQEAARNLLGTSLPEDSFVFSHPDGRPLTPDVVSHEFKKTARRAGLGRIRLHDMRHYHASLMLQQGIHPKIVSERLGHASIQMTLDTYSHVLPGLQESAARKFDEGLSEMAPTATVETIKETVG